MKTAILKTSLWDDDMFYELNIDTKLLYLLLMSAPERGVSDIYRVSDRILSARSGLNEKQLEVCKKQLQESALVLFKDSFVKLVGSAYVLPKKGRFTEQALEREHNEVPKDVLSYFTEVAPNSSLIVEHYSSTIYKDIDKDNNKDKDNNVDKEQLKEFRELNEYWASKSGRKLSDNKTSRDAYRKLRKEHSVDDIRLAINGASYFHGTKYKPQVMSFAALYEKWDNLTGHMTAYQKEQTNAMEVY